MPGMMMPFQPGGQYFPGWPGPPGYPLPPTPIYPPGQFTMPGWPNQPGSNTVSGPWPGILTQSSDATVADVIVEYPLISQWLLHCDYHPARSGDDFSSHAWKFETEGYRRINQLTADNRFLLIEKLSAWLGIGKGIADLITRYAEEDVALVRAGKFSMINFDSRNQSKPNSATDAPEF
jgi:hypothetical protein